MNKMRHENYMQLAQQAKQKAYAPYSGFRVGACAVDKHGCYAVGCNVENASYGATLCAERNAACALLATGLGKITAIYITSDSEKPTYPCGICRQVLYECNENMAVYVSGRDITVMEHYTISELLPHGFNGSYLIT